MQNFGLCHCCIPWAILTKQLATYISGILQGHSFWSTLKIKAESFCETSLIIEKPYYIIIVSSQTPLWGTESVQSFSLNEILNCSCPYQTFELISTFSADCFVLLPCILLTRQPSVHKLRSVASRISGTSHAAQHTKHNYNQAHSKERSTHTQKHIVLPQHQS